MARSASKPGITDHRTRFGESAVETEIERLGVGSVIVAKYRLERLLGEGGMGTVWCAHHLQLDLPVAIKLLRAGADQGNLAERLKVEARAVARLAHSAIVRVFDIDTTESGEPFIVMELLEGESLSELLDRGRLSEVLAVQTLLPIAEGLALAHAKGIVHRDLKPHNVFIVRDGERVQPKLLDFGIAKLTSPLPTGSLTDTGVLLGSPDYMSPEQARGRKDVDFRADIWQFCVVLFESIAGCTPFEGENYNALMRAIVEDEPRALALDENVDRRLSELVSWGLAKDRTKRPASIQELARALAEWLLERGVNEDITGAPLAARWLTRPSQKSSPFLQTEAEQEQQGPLPVRNDTLLSPRLPPRTAERSVAATVEPARFPSALTVGRWGMVAVFLALIGGLVWALMRHPAGQSATPHNAAGGVLTSSTPLPLPATAVELAPNAPQPSASDSPSSPALVNSAPLTPGPARSSKLRTSRPTSAGSAPGATKPVPVGHDETHELLQAY